MTRLPPALLLVLLPLVLLACSGGDGETPPAATVTTSTTTSTACPVAQDVCDFARTVDASVQAGNLDAVVANARLSNYTCPGSPPMGLGGPFPLCDNVPAGQVRSGIALGYLQSEGLVVTRERLQQDLARWLSSAEPAARDAYGNGATHLYTAGCVEGVLPCEGRFALVFSNIPGIQGAPFRSQMILFFEEQGQGQPQLIYAVLGPLLDPTWEMPALQGGAVDGFVVPEGWPPMAAFYALP